MGIGLSSGGTHGYYLTMMGSLGPRVRGVRSRLLTKEKLRAIVYAESIDDVVNALRDTGYKTVVERIEKITAPEEITKEFKTAVIRDLVQLALGSPPQARYLLSVYLLKFEIDNIKIVAKCLYEGKDRRDMERLANTYIAEIMGRRHVLTYILGSRDLEDLGSKLKELYHPAAEVFENLLKLIKARPQLALCIIDTILDSVYLSRLYTITASKLMRDNSAMDVVKTLVDFYNLSLLLRAKLWNLPLDIVQGFAVPFGTVGANFSRYYGEPVVRVLEELSANPLVTILTTIAKGVELETIVQKLSIAQYKAAYLLSTSIVTKYSPASPGAALSVAYVKDLEAELVATIVRCFIEGVSKALIRSHFEAVL